MPALRLTSGASGAARCNRTRNDQLAGLLRKYLPRIFDPEPVRHRRHKARGRIDRPCKGEKRRRCWLQPAQSVRYSGPIGAMGDVPPHASPQAASARKPRPFVTEKALIRGQQILQFPLPVSPVIGRDIFAMVPTHALNSVNYGNAASAGQAHDNLGIVRIEEFWPKMANSLLGACTRDKRADPNGLARHGKRLR